MKKISFICIVFTACASLFCAENESLAKALAKVIQPSRFAPGLCTDEPTMKVVDALRPILREQLAETNYDRLSATLQLVNHLKSELISGQPLLPLISTFSFNPLLSQNRGGPCVALTLDLYQRVPKQFNPYVIAAKLPSKFQQLAFPYFCHTAILIETQHAYILLDSSFDFHEPIVIKKDGKQTTYCLQKKTNFHFQLKDQYIICQIEPIVKSDQFLSEDYVMMYRTDRLLNPIQSSAIPMIFADRRLSLLSRRENGFHIAHLNIELDRKRILWDHHDERFEPLKFSRTSPSFPSEFIADLFLQPAHFNQSIQSIIENTQLLDQFYLEYLTYLRESQDTSIVGLIDPTKLQDKINAISGHL